MTNPPFNTADVEAAIAGTQLAGRVHHFASTSSTNTLALGAAAEGTSAGVWIADEQTAGRGRGGHTWHSPAFVDGHAAGLYVSVLVRPRLFGAGTLKLSLAAGLAAQAAISESIGVGIDLRWPNDLMLTGPDGVERKLGGILTESSLASGPDAALAHAVIGIGINLNHAQFPQELAPLATSLRMVLGKPVSREAILAALLRQLEAEIGLVEQEAAGTLSRLTAPLNQRFSAASSWVHGLRVHVDEDDGYTGVTDGLDNQGLLRVRLQDGSVRTVRHGGVRRAGPATP
jgi:BirA family biotin operon repressor/biotin-[acetyl-CoA-carboxylase] ligase